MQFILEVGQQFFFFHSDHWQFMMLASIPNHVPKELSFGGMNQRMRGQDGRKRSKRASGTEKNAATAYLLTLSVRVVNAVTKSVSGQRKRAFAAAQQKLLGLFQTQLYCGMIRLLRAGDLGSSKFDTPSFRHHR